MTVSTAREGAAYMLAHGTPFERHLAEAWYSGGDIGRRRLVHAFPDRFLRVLPSIGDI